MERDSSFFNDIQKWFWMFLGTLVSFGIILPSVIESAHDQMGISDLAAYHWFCIIYFFLFIFVFIFWVIFFSRAINSLHISGEKKNYSIRLAERLHIVKTRYGLVLVICLLLVMFISLFAIMSNADLGNGIWTLLMFLPLFVVALIYILNWRHPVPERIKGNALIILFFSLLLMFSWRAFISKNAVDKNQSAIQPVWSGAATTFTLYRVEKNKIYEDQLIALQKKINLRSGLIITIPLPTDTLTRAWQLAKSNMNLIAGKLLSLNVLLNRPVTRDDENDFTASLIDSLFVFYTPIGVKENFNALEKFVDTCRNTAQLSTIKAWQTNVSMSNTLLAADITALTKEEFSKLISVTQNKGLFVFVAALLLLMQLWLILYLKYYDLGESVKRYGDSTSEEDKKLIADVKVEAANCRADLVFTETFIFLIALMMIPLVKSVPANKVNLNDPIQQLVTPFYNPNYTVQQAPLPYSPENTSSPGNNSVQIYIYGKPDPVMMDTVTVKVLDDDTRKRVNDILNSVRNISTKGEDKRSEDRLIEKIKHGPTR